MIRKQFPSAPIFLVCHAGMRVASFLLQLAKGNMAWNPLFSATTYGRKPRATDVPDEFKLRIYTGGLAGGGTADERAAEAIEKFKSENGYSTYEIVSRESRWFPSAYDYTVRFRKQ